MTENLERIDKEIAETKKVLRRLERERQDEINHRAAPFKVGDMVEARLRRDEWAIARVVSVEKMSTSYWYTVTFRNKNGEWSKAERRVFGRVRRVEG